MKKRGLRSNKAFKKSQPNDASHPYLSFLKEILAFHSSASYLLNAERVALISPKSQLGKALNRLTAHVRPTYKDSFSYFLARMFISHVASFEAFLQQTTKFVLRQHPKKVGSVAFSLSDILDLSQDELVQRAMEHTLNELMYKKPLVYLTELCKLLSISDVTLRTDWKIFVEAKARRDLGVHNSWVCNAVYLRKLTDADIAATLMEGDSAVVHDLSYLETLTEAFERLSLAITQLVFEKHARELLPMLA